MSIKVSPELNLKFLAIDAKPLIDAIVSGFTPDPGTSDLDDEQPIHVCIPLGEYRRAQRLKWEVDKSV